MFIEIPTTPTPYRYGFFSVAQEITPSSAHWQLGIVYQTLCPGSNVTYSECISDLLGIEATPPNDKQDTSEFEIRGATPFVPYSRVSCSPVGKGMSDEFEDDVTANFIQSEEWQVERSFWTGQAQGETLVYPHLAADSLVIVSDITYQESVDTVDTTAVGVVEGLGRLEQALGTCYRGPGVIHMPTNVVSILANANALTVRNGVLMTLAGHRVIAGMGYPGTAPDGTSTSGETWLYATGNVFYARSDVITFTPEESFDRNVNTLSMIAERPYVVGYECCLLGIPVDAETSGS